MNGIMKLTLVAALGFFASGCWIIDVLFPSGFTVKTTFSTPPSPTQSGVTSPDPNVRVIGHFTDFASSCGNITGFDITTDGEGKMKNRDFVANGWWSFQRIGGHTGCGLINISGYASCGGTATLPCSSALAFGMAPESIDVNAPPATATFTGEGLDTTYGMPTIEFYDEYGTFFNQTTASTVSADGTSLQAAVPSLAGLYSGTYTIVIVNATADGSRNAVGTASVWVYGNDMLPPPPDPLPDPNPCGSTNGIALECQIY
jgi:hypothetical protein